MNAVDAAGVNGKARPAVRHIHFDRGYETCILHEAVIKKTATANLLLIKVFANSQIY